MIVLYLSVLTIGLAILERIIYKKAHKDLWKVRLSIGILMAFILLTISYFVTDSAISTIYVFIATISIITMGLVNNRSHNAGLRYIVNIVGLPIIIFLMIKSIQNMLIAFNYFILFTIIINWILSYSYKRKGNKKENISLVIGFALAAGLMFSYNKLYGQQALMLKQERIALEYLEDELQLNDAYVYSGSANTRLRGEDITMKAFSSRATVTLTYRDGQIIDHVIQYDE